MKPVYRVKCLVLGAVGLAAGCAHTEPFVWADEIDVTPRAVAPFTIRPGDVLNVRVWNQGQDAFPPKVRVRHDGRITLPLVNDVDAAGTTPGALAVRIQQSLKPFIVNPLVTVTVEESRVPTISVIGQVNKPGVYPLEPGAGVLQALAAGGGMTLYADSDGIYVLRHHSPPQRIRFRYDWLSRGVGHGALFELQDGDVVVVE